MSRAGDTNSHSPRRKRALPDEFALWDGTDAYGRAVLGSVTATVRIGYELAASYGLGTGSGAAFGDGASVPTTGAALAPAGRDVGRVQWRTQLVALGAPSMEAAGLGGWTISPHHIYDPNGRGTLYLGDGSTRLSNRLFPTVKLWGGNGQNSLNDPFNPGDGTESAKVRAMTPQDLAAAPDGSVYATDATRGIVGRIGPDGLFYRVAGKPGSEGGAVTPADGIDAKLADLGAPHGVCLGPDGSVFFADPLLRKVFRVAPDGKLWLVAGDPSGTYTESMAAVSAPLANPLSVAVAPDGAVFVGDDNRIFRIGPNGLIRTYAGTGTNSPGAPQGRGDEGRADSLAVFGWDDLACDANGELYIAETASRRIRRVTRDGRLVTAAYADDATLYPSSIAFGPDGALYCTQRFGNPAAGGAQSVRRVEQDGTFSIVAGAPFPASDFTQQDGKFARGARIRRPLEPESWPGRRVVCRRVRAKRIRRQFRSVPYRAGPSWSVNG